MYKKTRNLIPLIILLLFMPVTAMGQLCPDESSNGADYCPWPMFHHDVRHTGKTSNFGTQVGKLKWQFNTAGPVTSSPAIKCEVDDVCYAGCQEDLTSGQNSDECIKSCQDCTVYVGSADNNFYAIDSETGALKWKYTTNGAIEMSSPAIDKNGVVYVGSNDSMLYAFDTNNINFLSPQPKWTFKTGGAISSSPSIDKDGSIIFASNDGYLYSVSPYGTMEWKTFIGASWCSPAIDTTKSQAYIGSWKPQGSTVTFIPVEIDNETVNIAATVNFFAINTSNGSIKWDFPGNPFEFCVPGGMFASPVIGPDGSVIASYFITFKNPSPCDSKLWKYNIFNLTSSGDEVWALNLQSDADIYSTPAMLEDNSIFVGADNQLFRILPDMTDYLSIAATESNRIESSPAIDGGKLIYYGSNGGRFFCISADSPQTPLLWQYPDATSDPLQNDDGTVASIISSPAIGTDSRKSIYVGSSDGSVYAFYDGPRIYGNVTLTDPDTNMERPFSGVKIILTSKFTDEIRETYTDTNGNYEFTGVENYTYTVTPEKVQYYFSPTSAQATIYNDHDAPNIDFKAFFGFTVSGYIIDSAGNNFANVLVTITGDDGYEETTVTDASGRFEFSGLNSGSYTITPSMEGYKFTPSSQDIDITTSSIELDNEFIGFKNSSDTPNPINPEVLSISGHVILNSNDDNATESDVTVYRYYYLSGHGDNTGDLVNTVNPTKDGKFVFSGIESDKTYIIKPQLDGFGFDPVSITVEVGSSSISGLSFVGEPGLYLAGKLTTLLGDPIEGVTVTLENSETTSTISDKDGGYIFRGLDVGETYTISIDAEGYTSRPTSHTVTLSESREDVNFTVSPTCPIVYMNIPFWGTKGTIVNIFGKNFGFEQPDEDTGITLDNGLTITGGVYFGTSDPKTWIKARDIIFWSPVKIVVEAPEGGSFGLFGLVNIWVINETGCRYVPAPQSNFFLLY